MVDIKQVIKEFDQWRREDTDAFLYRAEVEGKYPPMDWEEENNRIKEWIAKKLQIIKDEYELSKQSR